MHKEFRKRKEQRKMKQWMHSSESPLVGISVLGMSPQEYSPQIKQSRGMGFVLEQFSDGVNLVATCRHNLEVTQGANAQIIVSHRGRGKPTTVMVIGDPIHDPRDENDLSFILIQDSSETRKRLFSIPNKNPKLPRGRVLYNAKNSIELFPPKYNIELFRQSNIRESEYIAYCSRSKVEEARFIPKSNTEEIAEYEAMGGVRYRVLNMISRPGFSGSPIFDKQGVLYGMDARGQYGGKMGDLLGCMPVTEISAARKRADEIIKKRLEELTSHK